MPFDGVHFFTDVLSWFQSPFTIRINYECGVSYHDINFFKAYANKIDCRGCVLISTKYWSQHLGANRPGAIALGVSTKVCNLATGHIQWMKTIAADFFDMCHSVAFTLIYLHAITQVLKRWLADILNEWNHQSVSYQVADDATTHIPLKTTFISAITKNNYI